MNEDTELHSHRVRLRTGVTLRCTERAGGGDALLLLHGYSDSGRSFEPILPALPCDLRLLAPDQRGHGDSDRPEGGYAIADLAADAAALLDAAGVRTATVVGHSMGSFVAQQLTLDRPERVARLVLIGAAPHGAGDAVKELTREIAAFTDPVSEEFVRGFQTSTLHAPVPEAFFEGVVAESCKLPARVWRAVAEGICGFDVRERLRAIACPTLVVWGRHDAIFGLDEQERLMASIPGAELRVYEDAGYSPHWEQPAPFARDLAEFLGRAPQRLPS